MGLGLGLGLALGRGVIGVRLRPAVWRQAEPATREAQQPHLVRVRVRIGVRG